MSEEKNESSANGANLQRVVMCTTSPDREEHRRIKKAMKDAGIQVVGVGACKTTIVIEARDFKPTPMVLLNDDRNSQFGRRRKKGGFRKYT